MEIKNFFVVGGNVSKGSLKCHRCAECNGMGCPGMLPGLGGVFEGKNFQLNFTAWKELFAKNRSQIEKINFESSVLRCGPVTGAVENIGYENEKDFYYPYLKNAFDAGFGLCVGDGYPDEKLMFGIDTVKQLSTKAAFFLKPYPDDVLAKRIELVLPYAEYIGLDIDSYNILTMRNLVHLEKKSANQLIEIKNKINVPFVIKGVFTDEDLDLVREVRPDVVYISNHGGRVETKIGSTGEFLGLHANELKNYCKEIWVDGGIRTKHDIQTAIFYGADKVIIARPFIRATFDDEYSDLKSALAAT